ncbi:MAG: myo-inosose-2 dehydratase [Elusimicrobiota bacterium]
MLDARKVRIGAQPIIWSNDDFFELGESTSLEQCLSEMRAAGYAGTELGHKFPSDSKALKEVLSKHSLELISGWHSTYLASKDFEAEKKDFLRHLDLLEALGSKVAIAAECTGRTYNIPHRSMGRGSCSGMLDQAGWQRMCVGLEVFGKLARDRGMKLVYHPHMGTVVETRSEIDRLMDGVKSVWLLADTGHFFFAGIEPIKMVRDYRARIAHVHLKNVRRAVVEEAVSRRLSFRDAVKRGVFTVPGDNGIDYAPIFKILAEEKYAGWMVVEAEQDPAQAPPLEYARRARAYIKQAAGV